LYAEPDLGEYRPEATLADLEDGGQLPALCFNLPLPPQPEQENLDYARKLAEVARRVGLPEAYVNRIGQRRTGGAQDRKKGDSSS
jgi:hypothetical protein